MLLALAAVWYAGFARGDSAVNVELENLSGEDKADWPVVLRVCHVLGGDLSPGAVNPDGFHVFGPDGRELPCSIERIPPYDWPGNDELVFLVPAMKAGQKLTFRVTNTAEKSASQAKLDIAASPHNLISDGGFESDPARLWAGAARLDAAVKRSGKSSLLIEGAARQSAKYTGKLPLHKGSLYYGGVWCRTENVARHGVAAGEGAYFKMTGFAKALDRAVGLMAQCYTRDWNKSRFHARYGLGTTEWGVDLDTVQADTTEATLELILDQKKQFWMDDAHGKWWLDDMVLIEQPKVTVRFDETLAPLLKDGVFLFTRPTNMPLGELPTKKFPVGWCAMPFAHEALTALDRWGLKGQRVPFLIGLYHTRPLDKVSLSVSGPPFTPELVEYSNGYLNNAEHHYLMDYSGPVDFPGPAGVRYFVITYRIPRDAKPGRYAGTITLASAGKPLREIPLTLRVQDIEQPVLKDRYIGMIMQASPIVFNEDTLSVYARSGFSCVTIFGGFLKYTKGEREQMHVDVKDLEEKMGLLMKHGVNAGVCPYTDLQLDEKPAGPGRMHGYARREAQAALKAGATETLDVLEKSAYFRLLRELDAACKAHPEWPRVIHMNWDEPGGPHPRMGWTNECLPDALTTLDAGFSVLAKVAPYYSMPTLDDPCDFGGPDSFNWLKKQGKRFGIAASARCGEMSRYQPGIWMAASGASYMHAWHLAEAGLMKVIGGKAHRAISMVACGEGMDDLKAFTLLTAEIEAGAKSADPKVKAAAAEAQKYLSDLFSVWTGDGAHASGNPPYLGWACTWGYDRFYGLWQERMARLAAALRGVTWLE